MPLLRIITVLTLLLTGASPLLAQSRSAGVRVRSEALMRGRHVVVVDLDANRLYFTRGERVLWSASVGTGTVWKWS